MISFKLRKILKKKKEKKKSKKKKSFLYWDIRKIFGFFSTLIVFPWAIPALEAFLISCFPRLFLTLVDFILAPHPSQAL